MSDLNSIGEITGQHGRDHKNSDFASLVAEARQNIRARAQKQQTEVAAHIEPTLPKHIYEGPTFNGKSCSVCKRPYKATSEYVTCKLCDAVVCRRKGTCKGVHHAGHRIEFLKAQKESKESCGEK